MAFKRKIKEEEIEEVVSRLKSGETYGAIGNSYGVTRQRIEQIASRFNLKGHGLNLRAHEKHLKWLHKMKSLYGEFFDGNKINERDLMEECKAKYRSKKYNSERMGIEFSVEFHEIIWHRKCPILGIEINYFSEGRQENSPSFDRIDKSKGYIKGNVQLISWRANRIRNDGTADEHKKIANYMSNIECQVQSGI